MSRPLDFDVAIAGLLRWRWPLGAGRFRLLAATKYQPLPGGSL